MPHKRTQGSNGASHQAGRNGRDSRLTMMQKLSGLATFPPAFRRLPDCRLNSLKKRMAFNHALRIMHFSLKQQAQANGQPQTGTAAINAERAMGLYLINVRKAHKEGNNR